jgi:hypothetical protein
MARKQNACPVVGLSYALLNLDQRGFKGWEEGQDQAFGLANELQNRPFFQNNLILIDYRNIAAVFFAVIPSSNYIVIYPGCYLPVLIPAVPWNVIAIIEFIHFGSISCKNLY